ncbi:CAP domain-containing protein [Sphingomonas donggukensis]|uniref:CAP domain-containing protein n=1 Tax=Sphingomonas donggukensis TaxID=2949093 RepID=A0ABY4TQV6_9SPHN|nr:CAP domain-containing protein [Sphingomonas donggukensis]URW74768.1 CAP domain-containing protein [Sphingomonas donggukensis]
MRKSCLALLLALAACAPQAPQRTVEERPFAGPAARGDADLRRAMLTMHNAARASVRQPPLVWDDALATAAAGYAREMARTGRFEHSPQPRGMPNQGENLWTGTRGAYRYDEMAQHWIDEKRDFVNQVTPNFSRTGDYRDVGHYAQIIWSRTTRVGCAMASNARDDYLVCRYVPAGNVVGELTLP